MEKGQKKSNPLKGSLFKGKVDHVLDLKGMILPLTLLKITQGLRKMGAGETMDIIGTDPDTRKDLLRVLGTSPCKVLTLRDENDQYLVRLRKETEKGF